MVLDSFRIGLCCCFVNAERAQKCKHDHMSRSRFGSKRAALSRKPERRMWAGIDETFARQSTHHTAYGDVRKPEALGKPANARFDASIE